LEFEEKGFHADMFYQTSSEKAVVTVALNNLLAASHHAKDYAIAGNRYP
jgi:hypothetical protein